MYEYNIHKGTVRAQTTSCEILKQLLIPQTNLRLFLSPLPQISPADCFTNMSSALIYFNVGTSYFILEL
jgi:hypothetical protein